MNRLDVIVHELIRAAALQSQLVPEARARLIASAWVDVLADVPDAVLVQAVRAAAEGRRNPQAEDALAWYRRTAPRSTVDQDRYRAVLLAGDLQALFDLRNPSGYLVGEAARRRLQAQWDAEAGRAERLVSETPNETETAQSGYHDPDTGQRLPF